MINLNHVIYCVNQCKYSNNNSTYKETFVGQENIEWRVQHECDLRMKEYIFYTGKKTPLYYVLDGICIEIIQH